MPRKNYSKSERKQQIIASFQIRAEHGKPNEATKYGIARALDVTPSQHLETILKEMVAEGTLSVQERDQRGRWTTRFYSLTNPVVSYHEKYGRRRILVKQRGRVAGQLEMAL